MCSCPVGCSVQTLSPFDNNNSKKPQNEKEGNLKYSLSLQNNAIIARGEERRV